VLLFERGISGKIAGQEIRALRSALPRNLPLLCSGRAVNLLAKPIPDVHTVVDFGAIVETLRKLGVLGSAAGATPDILPRRPARA